MHLWSQSEIYFSLGINLLNLPAVGLGSIDISKALELDRDVKKGYITSLFAFFMVAVFCLPSLARVAEHCPPSVSEHHEHQHISQHADAHRDSVNPAQKDSSSPEKHDCRCPAHRTSCCQLTYSPDNPNQSLSLSLRVSASYSEALFRIKPGPDLEGPFQPPRA
ncbi:hypothetical protein [Bdellovibrio sp.]|uniref:hypothetical protein n=1 Tax=Bdellovibrio sp. TaxID=28201 RepID=UPI0039E6AE97